MVRIGQYDTDLQMFVEPERPINLNRLAFERWLIEHDRAEHTMAGPPRGPLNPTDGAEESRP